MPDRNRPPAQARGLHIQYGSLRMKPSDYERLEKTLARVLSGQGVRVTVEDDPDAVG